MTRQIKVRYSYQFVKEYAELKGQHLSRIKWLGNRSKEVYYFYLNNKEYTSLKEIMNVLRNM